MTSQERNAIAADIKRVLRCSLCQHDYSVTTREPKNIGCGHNMCEVCLEEELIVVASDLILKCPVCRKNVKVSGGKQQFTTNHQILQMIEFADALMMSDSNPQCSRHREPITHSCFPCALPMCSECMAESCEDPRHSGHKIGLISVAVRDWVERIGDFEQKMKLYMEEVKKQEQFWDGEMCMGCKEVIDEMTERADHTRDQIAFWLKQKSGDVQEKCSHHRKEQMFKLREVSASVQV